MEKQTTLYDEDSDDKTPFYFAVLPIYIYGVKPIKQLNQMGVKL